MKSKKLLDAQWQHWETTFAETDDLFGDKPSEPARIAADFFQKEGCGALLELGAGQGRDTVFFARQGFQVHALDYSESGLKAIEGKTTLLGLSPSITVWRHDARQPLPFEDESFDACYSHMFFCMAFTTTELEFLTQEIRRVLKPGGLHIYTVRHTGDAHYGRGIHHGEDLYETNGFIVHFFSREKVNQLANGFEIVGIEEFEEAPLPRKLFRVTLRKPEDCRQFSGRQPKRFFCLKRG
jgi:SAM-dependent methyltransferase